MRFDIDERLGEGQGLSFLASAEWWNGLLEHVRRGSRLVADPSTGLQVVPGTDNNTLALAGTHRRCWARAGTPIGPPSGTLDAQMTSGTVRLWFVDSAGLRTDSGIDALAFNGWPGETVPANAWMEIDREKGIWEIKAWECA